MTRLISYCIIHTVLLLIVLCANSTGNVTSTLPPLDEETLKRDGSASVPIYSRPQAWREYNFEDFLWTGSGNGPEDLAQDGGLAWEDGGGVDGDLTDIVRVTKTMVLFRTVLTTIYPVEMTPWVITSSVSSTPKLVNVPSVLTSPLQPDFHSSDLFTKVYATKTVQVSISSSAEITSSMPNTEKTTEPDEETEVTTSPTTTNTVSPETDRLYWVQTVIKANRSEVSSHPLFQGTMQKHLARIYASAFKRHLMSSLGVFHTKKMNGEQNGPRLRRSSFLPEEEDVDTEWLYPGKRLTPSKLRSLATAAMNVTVSILNMTAIDELSHLSLNYIVCAEGNPVPATSAVQDLTLVTKQEMEREIGYEVINKAEALVASPLKTTELEVATSPWLIVAVTTIILMVFLLLVIMFMVWKWKHNRLSDHIITPARPQSGIEGGVINPAFLGPPSPIERSTAPHELPESSPSTYISHKHKNEPHPKRYSSRSSQKKEEQRALASELNILLSRKGEKLNKDSNSSDSQVGTTHGSNVDEGKTAVVRARHPSPHKRSSRRLHSSSVRGSGRKRMGSDEEGWCGESPPKSLSPPSTEPKHTNTFPSIVSVPNLDRELEESSSKGVDKISYGDLEVSQEAIARPISAKARKFLPKAPPMSGSAEESSLAGLKQDDRRKPETLGKEIPETIGESDDVFDDETRSVHEQDRDLSESTEQAQSTPLEHSTKDAQVQTPTRRFKPRTRRRGKHHSSESLISTESEEMIQVHELDSLSSDSNPMGKMRKRFHQFLDDAFNVIGKNDDDDDLSRSKSAKVSISHQVETRQVPRPWTSQVIREEVLQRLRPKSASFGPPKRAWSASGSGERRCNSAKSSTAGVSSRIPKGKATTIFERDDDSDLEDDLTSTPVSPPAMPSQPPPKPQIHQTTLNIQPVFPNYSIYPDIAVAGSSRHPLPKPNRETDPAVPLILAIKEEIKRFEKVVVAEEEVARSSEA
ncbi:unnamed protein product [Allacma fusca]|uniref:Transmembrane protein n=1 Tax=Allacma fusca TaxID=39272 RepID=A0A8J2KFY8_9HEXA|nr:unnamed protein product [Allacma fusca]